MASPSSRCSVSGSACCAASKCSCRKRSEPASGNVLRYVGAGLWLALGLGLLELLAGLGLSRALHLVTASQEVGRLAGEYLTVRMLGAPIVLVGVTLREARYGRGDSRTPMRATVAANVANIALDYLFIFGLGNGCGRCRLGERGRRRRRGGVARARATRGGLRLRTRGARRDRRGVDHGLAPRTADAARGELVRGAHRDLRLDERDRRRRAPDCVAGGASVVPTCGGAG